MVTWNVLGNDTEQVTMTTVLELGRLDLEIMIRFLSLYVHTLRTKVTLTKHWAWQLESLSQWRIRTNSHISKLKPILSRNSVNKCETPKAKLKTWETNPMSRSNMWENPSLWKSVEWKAYHCRNKGYWFSFINFVFSRFSEMFYSVFMSC